MAIILGALLLSSLGGAKVARADSGAPIGFELYSWKSSGDWRYAVFEGTAAARSTEMVRARKTRLNNINYLKGRLAGLPSKEIVYWRQDPARGFVLPPKEIILQIREFAESLQLDIETPTEPQLPGRPEERQIERLITH